VAYVYVFVSQRTDFIKVTRVKTLQDPMPNVLRG
jgi:hypothetical protein